MKKVKISETKEKTFRIMADQVLDFAEALEEHELNASLVGTTEDEELLFKVSYIDDEAASVLELLELVENEFDLAEEG